jgi:hypothetical protein
MTTDFSSVLYFYHTFRGFFLFLCTEFWLRPCRRFVVSTFFYSRRFVVSTFCSVDVLYCRRFVNRRFVIRRFVIRRFVNRRFVCAP